MTSFLPHLAALLAVVARLSGPQAADAQVRPEKPITLRGARSDPGLPLRVRRMLDSSHPGWRFATLAGPPAGDLPPGERPSWIAADLDGDRRRDYVVQLVARGGNDSLQSVIAFLRRGDEYRQVVIDSFPSFGGTYLMPVPAGGRVPDLDTDLQGDTARTLEHDGVTLVFAEKAATTCVYSGARFQCWTSGD